MSTKRIEGGEGEAFGVQHCPEDGVSAAAPTHPKVDTRQAHVAGQKAKQRGRNNHLCAHPRGTRHSRDLSGSPPDHGLSPEDAKPLKRIRHRCPLAC